MDETTRRDPSPLRFDSASAGNDPAASEVAPAAGSKAFQEAASPFERTAATQMTYASKLPPDHPGLQLETSKARTLRKGPILASVVTLGLLVGIALIVAFSPQAERARNGAAKLPDSPTKGVPLPDKVRNAPGNNSDLHRAPQVGPPRHGPPTERTSKAAGGYAHTSHEAQRESIRMEQAKAFGSPILVDVENPILADQNGPLSGPLASPPSLAASAPSGATGIATTIADPNMQQHKNDFLGRDGANSTSYLAQSLVTPRSPYEVKAGTIIPTTLITGINSDLPGQVVGQVRENVFDTVTGNYLLIPQGSRLIATYDSSVTFGQERVLVCWNRVIRPDGVSISLECMPGVDLAGYAGFADDVDHHWFRIITGVALGTLLSATAQRSQGDVTGYNPSMPQLWASNAGGTLNQAGQQITQKNLAIQPTIKVRPGFTVNVLVTKDIVLVPYSR